MKVLSKNLKNENLVIVGSNISTDFSITDDESSCVIKHNGKVINEYLSSDGFVSIVTFDQYKKWVTDDDTYPVISDALLLKNFKGEIRLHVVVNGKEIDNIDTSDYIEHQYSGNVEIYIDIIGDCKTEELDHMVFADKEY